ncbi:MAG: hypothetical protein ACXW0S_03390 [Solirubrobacterales bacterium]
MPAKPHRILLDAVSGYADEAAAYMRRRRHMRKPFARVHYAGGRSQAFPADAEAGRLLFDAAAHVLEAAGPGRRQRVARGDAPRGRGAAGERGEPG